MIAKLDLRDLVKLCSKSSTWSCLSLGDLRTIQGQHLYRQRPKLLLHTYAPIPYLRRRTALEFTRCTSSLSFFTFSLSLLRLRLFQARQINARSSQSGQSNPPPIRSTPQCASLTSFDSHYHTWSPSTREPTTTFQTFQLSSLHFFL
jgi:hypothetical protein